MGGPPSGTRPTLGRAALTGGGEHRAVGRTWAAAADSDLLWAPLPADDIFTLESAGRCEVPAACPCHHTNHPLTRGMLPRAEILIIGPRLDKLSARCSGPSKPSHISIARRRRCVEPYDALRASHVCSPSRASHPPGSSLSRCRWRSTSLHSARLLRREKSPRAPSRCSTGVHVLAARGGIRPEGAPMGLLGSLVQSFLERSAFSAPPPATHAQNGHS